MTRPRAAGFTLIELLVVVVIAGILMTVALLTVRAGGEERLARDEVRRLERVVQVAADEALFRVAEYGIEFMAGGYRFLWWDGAEWHPLPDPGVLRERRWPDALAASLEVEARPIALPPEFPAEDATPQVVLLSSGEVSPFVFALVADNGRGERLRVHLTAQAERTPVEGLR